MNLIGALTLRKWSMRSRYSALSTLVPSHTFPSTGSDAVTRSLIRTGRCRSGRSVGCVAQKVAHEFVAGKYYVTLAAIEEMRASCRVPAKSPTLPSKSTTIEATQPWSSETDSLLVAQDAMNMMLTELRKPSPVNSQRSTSQKKALNAEDVNSIKIEADQVD
jgi:hypothetical protein